MTEQSTKKANDDTLGRREDCKEPLKQALLNDSLSGKLAQNYMALSIATNDASCSYVLNRFDPAWLCEKQIYNRCEHISRFLQAIHDPHDLHANVSMSKPPYISMKRNVVPWTCISGTKNLLKQKCLL